MPQQPRRFQADTIDEAYEKVRRAFGDEAVILATRRATSPSIYGRPPHSFVEVLAHIPERSNVPSPKIRSGTSLRAGAAVAAADDRDLAPPFENPMAGTGAVSPELLAKVTGASEVVAQPMAAEPKQSAPIMADPRSAAASMASMAGRADEDDDPAEGVADELAEASATHGRQRTEFAQLLGEIGEMRGIVEQLAVERVDGRIDQSPAPLRWLRNRLRDQGVKSTLAATVLDQAADAHVKTAAGDAVRRNAERQLAGMLPPVAHLDLAKRPAFVALVGPAGAGKTTFAMKLAVELERAYSLRVVVAGTDVERAGAPQQFAAVGAAAGVQTRLCYTPGELRALIAEDIADIVVMDTPGHDGSRRDRMAELQTFIHASRHREVLLVLPATMKVVDLERLAGAYASVEPMGVVLTRCDNTTSLGEPFSALVETRLGLAFTTHLDAVSDAPRPGDNLALTRALISGEWAERRPTAARGRAA
jgi:flagellar biosynthesis protein FlhF